MRGSRGVAILVAAVLATAACSGDGDAAPSPVRSSVTTVEAAVPTTAEPPCRPRAGYGPGTTERRLTVGGVERVFLVHVPPQPAAAMPLVVNFHGAGSDMTQHSLYSGFDALADRERFVTATPNGVDAAIRQWRFIGTPDDVEFATAIVDDLVANACVDETRVYATGISSGAAMSASLACQTSDVFAGFGLVAANFYIPALCERATPRPMIVFHGTADAVVPYEGGEVATGAGLRVMPAEESAAAWAAHNGCASEPTETVVDTEVVRLEWSPCDDPVVLYRIVGGGHSWPGAIAVERLGHTTDQIDAAATMWAFFSETGDADP